MVVMKDSVRKAIFANASSKSKMLSHHFGSSDIDSRGSNFVINFGEKGYAGVSNQKINSFEKKYPKARLEIIPKHKKIIVHGLDQ